MLITTSACMNKENQISKQKENNSKQSVDQQTQNTLRIADPVVTKVTIGAVGDILVHNEVYEDAEMENGTYNFSKMFDEVRKTMEDKDILVANQETMIGGKENGLSTYPSFNSPFEVGDALKSAGVDFVTLANNHSLDRGEKIIQSALLHWDQINMPYTGAFKSQADHDNIRILTKNDIRFAFLAYTFGTNGIPIPKGKDYLVNLIDLKKIKQEVEKAKKVSDVIIVAMHWGNEYERFPNKTQNVLAGQLANMGVQIIIGHHPHVLQPPAWVKGKAGNKTFVMYSLGNFLSAQDELYELVGGIASIEVVKTTYNNQKMIELRKPSFMPTYNYYFNNKNFKIIPMENLNDDYLIDSETKYEEIKKHMKTYIKDLNIQSPLQ